MPAIVRPRGTNDLLPADGPVWEWVLGTHREVAAARPGEWIVVLGGWSEEQFSDDARGFPLAERITDPRVKAPPPVRATGRPPHDIGVIAARACTELGLPALLLACAGTVAQDQRGAEEFRHAEHPHFGDRGLEQRQQKARDASAHHGVTCSPPAKAVTSPFVDVT